MLAVRHGHTCHYQAVAIPTAMSRADNAPGAPFPVHCVVANAGTPLLCPLATLGLKWVP
jgi:hypothetical protein